MQTHNHALFNSLYTQSCQLATIDSCSIDNIDYVMNVYVVYIIYGCKYEWHAAGSGGLKLNEMVIVLDEVV